MKPDLAAGLDRIIHEPARLAVLSALAASPEIAFTDLRDLLNMTDGNLSTHLRHLENAGYVRIEKGFSGRRPLTTLSITAAGRKAFQKYLQTLEKIVHTHRMRGI